MKYEISIIADAETEPKQIYRELLRFIIQAYLSEVEQNEQRSHLPESIH